MGLVESILREDLKLLRNPKALTFLIGLLSFSTTLTYFDLRMQNKINDAYVEAGGSNDSKLSNYEKAVYIHSRDNYQPTNSWVEFINNLRVRNSK